MGLIGPLLAVEVPLGIAPGTVSTVVLPVLAPEALQRRPCLDQGAVHREVFARQQSLHARLRQHRRQELRRDLAFKQPVAVLGEGRMVPNRVVHPEADEPAEQQVERQTLHQLALGTDPIERLEQHRPKQLLRRNRRPPEVRIEGRECPRQIAQRGVRNPSDRPQRMVTADPRLQVHIAE